MRVPKYCHHKGTGQGYATDPRSKSEVYFGRYESAEARQAYAAWVSAFVNSDPPAPAPSARGGALTVAELWVRFFQYAARYYQKRGQPTSSVKNFRAVATLCLEVCPDVPAQGLTPGRLKHLRGAMIERGLARNTVNQYVRRLKSTWRWAVAEELVPPATLLGLCSVGELGPTRGGRETEDVPPVPRAVVEATLPHLRAWVQTLVRLQLASGCRPGEAVCVRARDLDRAQMPWVYTPYTHKNEHRGLRRLVYLGPLARELLAPLLAGAGNDDWLFPKRRGRPGHVSEPTYARRIRCACQRLAPAVPPWHVNQLRHTRGTEVRAAHGLEAAQGILGHEAIATTQIYAGRLEDLARIVAEQSG